MIPLIMLSVIGFNLALSIIRGNALAICGWMFALFLVLVAYQDIISP